MADQWASTDDHATAPAAAAAGGWASTDDHAAQLPGALARFGSGLYDSTIGPLVQLAAHPIDTVKAQAKQLLGTDELSAIADHVSKGEFGHAAALALDYAQGPGPRIAKGITDPIVSDVQSGNYAGATGRVIGTGAMLAAPGALKAIPAEVGTALKGGAVGALKGAVGTTDLTRMGVSVKVPEVAAGVAVGGAAAQLMGLPHELGVIAGGAVPILRGAVRGAKSALAERSVPPEKVTIIGPARQLPGAPDIIPMPAAPPLQLAAGAPDASFVRSVPAKYPEVESPSPIAESGGVAGVTPPFADLPQAWKSQGGNLSKTAAKEATDYQAKAQARKAQALAKFLFLDGEGISSADAAAMGPEEWKIAAKGARVNAPSAQSQRLAMKALKKLEDLKAAQSQAPASATIRPPAGFSMGDMATTY